MQECNYGVIIVVILNLFGSKNADFRGLQKAEAKLELLDAQFFVGKHETKLSYINTELSLSAFLLRSSQSTSRYVMRSPRVAGTLLLIFIINCYHHRHHYN